MYDRTTSEQRRKRGEGAIAIANYVRKHHPEIIEAAKREQIIQQRKVTERMLAGLAKAQEARRKEKANKLLAQLAGLGVVLIPTEPTHALSNGDHSPKPVEMNGRRFLVAAR